MPTNTVDREGEEASICSPSFPVGCPGTHKPGASTNAPPRFPRRESQIATLSKPKAQVSVLVSRCRKRRGYLERKQRRRPQETPSLVYASLFYRPQPSADLPDLFPPPQVATQHLAPSPPRRTLLRAPLGEGKGRGAARRSLFPPGPARPVLLPLPFRTPRLSPG